MQMSIFFFFSVSAPQLWRGNTAKIERIQYRALKVVFKDKNSTYQELLAKANLPTLEIRRLRQIAIETFKILHSLTPAYLNSLVTLKQTKYNLRNRNASILQRQNNRTTSFGLHSFKSVSAKIWADLPNDIKNLSDISSFKRSIRLWSGPSCKCPYCKYKSPH